MINTFPPPARPWINRGSFKNRPVSILGSTGPGDPTVDLRFIIARIIRG
jgi:hypothetical protein